MPEYVLWIIPVWALMGFALGLASLFPEASKRMGILAIGLNLLSPFLVVAVLLIILR